MKIKEQDERIYFRVEKKRTVVSNLICCLVCSSVFDFHFLFVIVMNSSFCILPLLHVSAKKAYSFVGL